MKLGRLAWVVGACWLVAGCGARTSEDDLLGYGISGGPSVGGDGSGGSSAGGSSAGGSLTGGAPSGGGTGGRGGASSCCVASTEPGCLEDSVYQCVCSFDGFCCDQAWDSTCVDEAVDQCSLQCGGGPSGGAGGTGGSSGGAGGTGGAGGSGGTGGTFGGDCCAPHGGVGCGVPPIMECVCDADPYCCSTSWDQICANESVQLCGADCMSGTGGAGIGGSGSGGSGIGGSGVGGQSTGGSGGTGGQGTGGNAGQCDVVFPDACGNCLCNDCFEPLDACLDDFGCLAIFACISSTGCSGAGCLSPSACGNTFAAFGGVTGPSAQTALGLIACAVTEGCPCD